VIIVLECDVALLREAEAARASGVLDEEQRRQLNSAFDMFDADGSGALSRSEVLRALDVENRNDGRPRQERLDRL
jgi:Ca2+-binding EF-hand superfamily protein